MTGLNRSLVILFLLSFFIIGILFILIPMSQGVDAMQNYQIGTGTPTPALGIVTDGKLDLVAFAEAPFGEVDDPYIVLSAFGNVPAGISIEIQGVINNKTGYICNKTPCKLPLSTDSTVSFQANTNAGNSSREYSAVVRISQPSLGKYSVTVITSPPEQIFSDNCSNIWGIYGVEQPNWAVMPGTPAQLNTDETLHFLANLLILKGVVDVRDCPSGGMTNGAPNACGIEHARQAIVEWQNKFDFDIWIIGKSIGIPPILLKTLILRESQFWPGNAHYYLAEIGLAQINDLGADVALRWDPNLYLETCSSILSNCTTPYMRLPDSLRAMVRGALLTQLNAECPTCKYGLDMEIAHASISTIARVIQANCRESGTIINQNNATVKSYEDHWKFTMVSYHSGYGCLNYAIQETKKAEESMDWQHVSAHLKCSGAREYIDNFWNSLTTFNNKVIVPSIVENAIVNPLPKPTIVPYPTATFSNASVRVKVFVDKNGNGIPELTEGVKGVAVKLTLSNGLNKFGMTNEQGEAVFDLTGRAIGEVVVVSLENLYRSMNLILPETGEVEALFKFVQPVLPSALP
jgi:hypothetical protein